MCKPLTERQQAFLDAYRTNGLVKPAAEQAGCSRELHYGALRSSETYREAFAMVQRELVDELEEEARRRAIYGVKIPKLYRGKVIGYETRYSDTLLMYLLEANDPEKFDGIRQELQKEERENGFCVRWDRDEVARPSLPRMTGPQPPMPPRPPRPPLPPIGGCSEPVGYVEWAAARACADASTRGPVDQEKLDRWATSENPGSVEWVPDAAARDFSSDDADADLPDEAPLGDDCWGSDDSDVGFCVRSSVEASESPRTLGRFHDGSASGEGRGEPPTVFGTLFAHGDFWFRVSPQRGSPWRTGSLASGRLWKCTELTCSAVSSHSSPGWPRQAQNGTRPATASS